MTLHAPDRRSRHVPWPRSADAPGTALQGQRPRRRESRPEHIPRIVREERLERPSAGADDHRLRLRVLATERLEPRPGPRAAALHLDGPQDISRPHDVVHLAIAVPPVGDLVGQSRVVGSHRRRRNAPVPATARRRRVQPWSCRPGAGR